ncbi:hypothetical protein FSP39_004349, partial [Pinctada imbricata]
LAVSLSEGNHGTVYIDGNTLCGPIFQKEEASVLCRHLNYSDGIVLPPNIALHSDKFQLNCNGNESFLSECEMKPSFCSRSRHYYYKSLPPADVLCFNDVESVAGSIELVSNVGRVTVNMYGIAAAVCADTFDDRSASVTCRMKGYKDGAAFDINKSAYEDLVLLGAVRCLGNESSLFQCQISETRKCKQAYAVSAGVICFNDQAPIVQFDGQRGLYTVTVDHRVIFYCLQGQFYPHNRFAPHHDPPKDTIACKSLVFVEEKEHISKKEGILIVVQRRNTHRSPEKEYSSWSREGILIVVQRRNTHRSPEKEYSSWSREGIIIVVQRRNTHRSPEKEYSSWSREGILIVVQRRNTHRGPEKEYSS